MDAASHLNGPLQAIHVNNCKLVLMLLLIAVHLQFLKLLSTAKAPFQLLLLLWTLIQPLRISKLVWIGNHHLMMAALQSLNTWSLLEYTTAVKYAMSKEV